MRKVWFYLLLVITFVSCRPDLYDESHSFEGAHWAASDRACFDVLVDDTITTNTFNITLRHLETYRYANLYIFLHTTFPNGNMTTDTIECLLAHPDGRWATEGSRSMRSGEVMLNNCLRFPQCGIYHFELEQAMRTPDLQGVADVGIHIKKNS